MLFKKDHIEKLIAALGVSKSELLAKIREPHPELNFKEVYVVADEEVRYVAIATYEVTRHSLPMRSTKTIQGSKKSITQAMAWESSDRRARRCTRQGFR